MNKIKDNDFYPLFSLFHHDISASLNGESILNQSLLKSLNQAVSTDEKDIGDVLVDIVKESIIGLKDNEIGLTLTGGFDSRVILSVLLHLNVKPVCYTYGNENNKDIKIAKEICQSSGLTHIHVGGAEPSPDNYLQHVQDTIRLDSGNAHLHRAHRAAAAREIALRHKPKILFTGHLGGEQIRGLSYNNYFSSSIFRKFNENGENLEILIPNILQEYFLKSDTYDTTQLVHKIKQLSWMQDSPTYNRLHFIYDLIGFNHHQQDLRIFNTHFEQVIPVYLDMRFIEVLMKSRHHFMRKTKSKFAALSHPMLYCKLLERFHTPLLDIKLSNGYKPRDFNNGIIYYSTKRLWTKYIQKATNPPSFAYGNWYKDFITVNSESINEPIWEIYDKKAYFQALKHNAHQTNEGYWHKFSNPIFFNLVLKIT